MADRIIYCVYQNYELKFASFSPKEAAMYMGENKELTLTKEVHDLEEIKARVYKHLSQIERLALDELSKPVIHFPAAPIPQQPITLPWRAPDWGGPMNPPQPWYAPGHRPLDPMCSLSTAMGGAVVVNG